MEKGDKSLTIVGVQHLATKNNLTVRARIYLRRFDGLMYTFDADSTIWELQKLDVKQTDSEELGILGTAE